MEKNIQTKAEQKKRKGFFSNAKLRLFTMCMALASMMSLAAFAADGETTTSTATISSLLTEAGTTIPSMMSLAWNVITSNPLTTLSVIVMVAGIAFSLIRRARHAVR